MTGRTSATIITVSACAVLIALSARKAIEEAAVAAREADAAARMAAAAARKAEAAVRKANSEAASCHPFENKFASSRCSGAEPTLIEVGALCVVTEHVSTNSKTWKQQTRVRKN